MSPFGGPFDPNLNPSPSLHPLATPTASASTSSSSSSSSSPPFTHQVSILPINVLVPLSLSSSSSSSSSASASSLSSSALDGTETPRSQASSSSSSSFPSSSPALTAVTASSAVEPLPLSAVSSSSDSPSRPSSSSSPSASAFHPSASLAPFLRRDVSLLAQLKSLSFWLTTLYALINATRSNALISSINEQLKVMGEGYEPYAESFSILLPCVLPFIPLVGWLLAKFPLWLSTLFIVLFSVVINVLLMIPSLPLQVFTILLFSFWRVSFYSAMGTTIAYFFGFNNFGRLIGLIYFVAGVFGFSQYLLLLLAHLYSFTVVNVLWLFLQVSMLGFVLFIRYVEKAEQQEKLIACQLQLSSSSSSSSSSLSSSS
jgi:hypothetical protein